MLLTYMYLRVNILTMSRSPETYPYPTDAELLTEVIAHKFRSATDDETNISEFRPSEEVREVFPTTTLPGHSYPENVTLHQPRADVEQPVYTRPHINGARLTFTDRPFDNSNTTYHTLFHIRNDEIHERTIVDWGLSTPMYDEGPATDEHTYGRPIDAERARQLIWWLESSE